MERLNKPIIMTAQMGKADFAWANGLRQRYFPPERNVVDAHITLFHHLPPQALDEVKAAIAGLAGTLPKPEAHLSGLIHLGNGVAYRLHAPELLALRMELADRFAGLLIAQDQQTPRLHITVQNKVSAREAGHLFDILSAGFEPRPFDIHGIGLHYYLDGPWQTIRTWPFRG
ncbi:2'-5' RNA ligase family protein [uncultured Parasphingorhabdus sp.]|uniref:2'-5' RNA ligase family protein n=1 Tax=uncultured Parasphingorhabdus sp. TaxID=2709694 RepID=UPI002AA6E5FB|nr:2'-5' RNA ligase family protein [uncultured Parasphingorhabdus sp.]